MKTTARNTNRNLLANTNEAFVNKLYEERQLVVDVVDILRVIAQAMDFMANGADYYLIIGTTKNRDAFQLNWKGQDAPGAVYAQDIAGLSEAAGELL